MDADPEELKSDRFALRQYVRPMAMLPRRVKSL